MKPITLLPPLLLAALTSIATGAGAATLNLSKIPLYLGSGVQPNILFLIDDSGSMEWESILPDYKNDGKYGGGTQPNGASPSGSGSILQRSGCDSGTIYEYGFSFGTPNCNVVADKSWRFRNSDFNKLYYNPNFTYLPWPGLDKSGNAFGQIDPTHAPDDPYNPTAYKNLLEGGSGAATINLSQSLTIDIVTTTSGSTCNNWVTIAGKSACHRQDYIKGAKCKKDKEEKVKIGNKTYYFCYAKNMIGDSTTTTTTTTTVTKTVQQWLDSYTSYTSSQQSDIVTAIEKVTCSGYVKNRACATGTPTIYYTWVDTDKDGYFDDSDQVNEFILADQESDVQDNFANWFSYYRSRQLVAKAAYGQVIAQANNVRMGLVTINKSSLIAIAEMNSDPASGAKKALLDKLYSFNPNNMTPLLEGFYNCGRYLECKTNSFFSSGCPALNEASGGKCQQNFIVVMTDGYYNGTFTSASAIANEDGDHNTSWDGGAYGDSYSDSMADIAMHFYERDLQPSVSNMVPTTPGVDEATHQHAVTFGVSFGVNGTLSIMPPNSTSAFSWPDPSKGDAQKIDDLRHAAFNGRGLFLSAQSPQELIDSLADSLGNIGDRTSSAASVALNSGVLNANSKLYQARFDSGNWTGQLLAQGVGHDGKISGLIWDAAVRLEPLDWSNDRAIISYNPNSGGVPFRWASLSAAQQNALNINPETGSADGKGLARLEYLRGSRDNEGDGEFFRERNFILGDMIHSSPFFISDGTQGTVFIGANDGMLHAFDAETGDERFAYVPGTIVHKLNKLTSRSYLHDYFVDGEVTVATVPNSSGKPKQILVGGLRGGGQAYFALDVSNAAKMSEGSAAATVLWEFSDGNDADMGYSFGSASIVTLNNGSQVAAFGNGFNNTEADGTVSSGGHAVLYLVDLSNGKLIRKITTHVGTSQDPAGKARPNGLSSPSFIDIDDDGKVDIGYAGDLFGNLWKFDLTSKEPANWKIAFGSTTAPEPLFKASVEMSGSVKDQPITTQPEVGYHPSKLGYLVYFGTGQYMETTDNITVGSTTQTFYSVWDKNNSSANPLITRTNMVQQSITSTSTVSGTKVRLVSNNTTDWGKKLGCYINLPDAGERVVSNSLLRKDRLIFTTLIPAGGQCQYGGDGWLMELDANCGGRLNEIVFDIDGDGKFTDDDLPIMQDPLPPSGKQSKEGIIPKPVVLSDRDREFKYTSGSTGIIEVTTESSDNDFGRRTWRRIR